MEFALPYYPGGFHPYVETARVNLTLLPLLYQGLFALDEHFAPQNELCGSYTVSEDGLTWTFQLAEAFFSDGTPLTGEDAAASLEEARRSERYALRLKDILRVTAGEGTVAVALARPNGALPSLLDVPIIRETQDSQRPLGTGPYVLSGEEDNLALTARPGRGMPLETIPLRAITAGDDLVYAFDAQEVSLVDTDLTGTDTLGWSGRYETTDYATTTLLYLGCNTASAPCREQEVRQALLRSFDRESAAKNQLAGHAAAAALPIHPAAEGYDAALAGALGQDNEKARELLTQAGWSRGEGEKLEKGRQQLKLRLLVNQENVYKAALAQVLAQSMENLGCVVTVEKLPWEEFLSALEKGEFDLYLGETTLTADFDLEALISPEGTLNYGGYSDPEAMTLLETWRGATGEARTRAARALYAHLAQTAPILPICFKNGSVLTQWGQTEGVTPTRGNVFFGIEE